MEEYVESMASLADKLHDFLTYTRAFSARIHLLNQLLPDKAWNKIISDDVLEQWEAEWEAEFKDNKKNRP